MNVCLGGTFNPFHHGHRRLIEKAFEVAGSDGRVFIGVTSGDVVKDKKNVKSFEQRKKIIDEFLLEQDFTSECVIKPIFDKFGPSVEGDFDAIVVSSETKSTAEQINRKRKEVGRKPLRIFEVSMVLAEDGVPISSTRIRNNEIDEDGTLIG